MKVPKSLPKGLLKTATEWHQFFVINDKDFKVQIEELRATGKTNDARITELSKQWSVGYMFVKDCLTDYNFAMYESTDNRHNRWCFYDKECDVMVVEFDPTITRKQYIELWDQVKREITKSGAHKATKRKEPHYPELLYAVFKATKEGLTFKEIFLMYENQSLPHYELNESTIMKSEDELEKYYRRHMPTLLYN